MLISKLLMHARVAAVVCALLCSVAPGAAQGHQPRLRTLGVATSSAQAAATRFPIRLRNHHVADRAAATATVRLDVRSVRHANSGRAIRTLAFVRVRGPLRGLPAREFSLLAAGGTRGHVTLRTSRWPTLRAGLRLAATFSDWHGRWTMIEGHPLEPKARAAWVKLGCCSFPPDRTPIAWKMDPGVPQWAYDGVAAAWSWWTSDPLSWLSESFQGFLGTAGDSMDTCAPAPAISFVRYADLPDPISGWANYCADDRGATQIHIELDSLVDYPLTHVAAHEIGHGIGFDHSPDPNALMFATWSLPALTDLGADDRNGLRALYPGRAAFALESQSGIDSQGDVSVRYPGTQAITFRLGVRGYPGCDPSIMRLRLATSAAAPYLAGGGFDASSGVLPFVASGQTCVANVGLRMLQAGDASPGQVKFIPETPDGQQTQGAQPSFNAVFDRCPPDAPSVPAGVAEHFCGLWVAEGGYPAMGERLSDAYRWGDGWVRGFAGGSLGEGVELEADGADFAYVVAGPYWQTYTRPGVAGPSGHLGYPLGPKVLGGHLANTENSTATMTFQRGVITSWQEGAYATWGPILARWQHELASAGWLGRPLSDEEPVAGPQGQLGNSEAFEHGTIIESASRAATYALSGPILERYRAAGGTASYLGLPTSEPAVTGAGMRQDFDGGYIVLADGVARTDRELNPLVVPSPAQPSSTPLPPATTRPARNNTSTSSQTPTANWSEDQLLSLKVTKGSHPRGAVRLRVSGPVGSRATISVQISRHLARRLRLRSTRLRLKVIHLRPAGRTYTVRLPKRVVAARIREAKIILVSDDGQDTYVWARLSP